MSLITFDDTKRRLKWVKVANDSTSISWSHWNLVDHINSFHYFFIDWVRPYLTIAINKDFIAIYNTWPSIRIILINFHPLLNSIRLLEVLHLFFFVSSKHIRSVKLRFVNANIGLASPIDLVSLLLRTGVTIWIWIVTIDYNSISGAFDFHITRWSNLPTELKVIVLNTDILTAWGIVE